MPNGYYYVANPNSTENGLLKDFSISTVPLVVTSIGRIFVKEDDYTGSTCRENGRLDYQLIYLKRGHMNLFLNGKKLLLESNTVLLFKPGEPQIYNILYTKEPKTVEYFYIHFSGSEVAEMLEKYNIHFQFVRFKEPFDAFEDCMNRMLIYEQGLHHEKFFSLILEELFIMLSSALQNEALQISSRSFGSLISTMKSTCTQNLPIKYYADFIGFQENYFLRFFKKAMKISPHKFLIQLRMNKACELLVYSQDPIKNIALRLGYQNQHHFSNAFHQYFQLSPTEYRIMRTKAKNSDPENNTQNT